MRARGGSLFVSAIISSQRAENGWHPRPGQRTERKGGESDSRTVFTPLSMIHEGRGYTLTKHYSYEYQKTPRVYRGDPLFAETRPKRRERERERETEDTALSFSLSQYNRVPWEVAHREGQREEELVAFCPSLRPSALPSLLH